MSIALSLEITLINCELYCESPENRRTARGSGWRHKCCSWTGFLTIRSLSQLHHSLWDLGTCEFTLLQLRNGDNSAFLCGSVLLRFHQPCRDWQCVFSIPLRGWVGIRAKQCHGLLNPSPSKGWTNSEGKRENPPVNCQTTQRCNEGIRVSGSKLLWNVGCTSQILEVFSPKIVQRCTG